MTCKPLALTWSLSTISGYGNYGIHLALQFIRRGGEKFITTQTPALTVLPTLTQVHIDPILEQGKKIAGLLRKNKNERLTFDHAVLHAVGNECAGFEGQDRISGTLNVGCAAIEHVHFGQHGLEYAKNYDLFIAISRWNEQFLKSLNLAPVHLCHQGIDTSLFSPGGNSSLWKNRFVIFSGGKFEFRKGQDIVTAAFKRFHARHPEAFLITCWQNLLPIDPAPFALAGHYQTVPQIDNENRLQVAPWLFEQGLPVGSFIDIPYTPNMFMPHILRECDAAIFPSRGEGGTNLVAMEAMACGIPTLVANNTGQKDLVDNLDCIALKNQSPVKATAGMPTLEDWGESDLDEIVEALEKIYTSREENRQKALIVAEQIKSWDWAPKNEKLLSLVCN